MKNVFAGTRDQRPVPVMALANSVIDALRRVLDILVPQPAPVPVPIPIRIDGR